MHRPLSHAEVEALNQAIPIMTVADRRERWAQLLEKVPHVAVTYGLESLPQAEKDAKAWPNSPMALAAADPVLKDAGLKGATIGDAKEFFDMTDAQIHAFNCGCHSVLTGQQMAYYIRRCG